MFFRFKIPAVKPKLTKQKKKKFRLNNLNKVSKVKVIKKIKKKVKAKTTLKSSIIINLIYNDKLY